MPTLSQWLGRQELFGTRALSKGMSILPFNRFVLGRIGTREGDAERGENKWLGGLWEPEGIVGNIAKIDRRKNRIQMLTPHTYGTTNDLFAMHERSMMPITVPQYDVLAEFTSLDVMNKTEFNSEEIKTVASLIAETGEEMVNAGIEPTMEWARICSITGRLNYGKTNEAYYDWNTIFSEVPFDVNPWANHTPTPSDYTYISLDVTKDPDQDATGQGFNEVVLGNVLDKVQRELGGVRYEGVIALCGANVWNHLLTNPLIREAFKFWGNRDFLVGKEWYKGITECPVFTYQNFDFIKYPTYSFGEYAVAQTADQSFDGIAHAAGDAITFPTNSIYFIPYGIEYMFKDVRGSGDFIDTISEKGGEYYFKQKEDKFQRKVEIYAQSNRLIFCQKRNWIGRLDANAYDNTLVSSGIPADINPKLASTMVNRSKDVTSGKGLNTGK